MCFGLCLNNILTGLEFQDGKFFFQCFKDVAQLSSCLHGVQWEICCNPYLLPVHMCFFPLAVFIIFLFLTGFKQFMMYLGVVFFRFILWFIFYCWGKPLQVLYPMHKGIAFFQSGLWEDTIPGLVFVRRSVHINPMECPPPPNLRCFFIQYFAEYPAGTIHRSPKFCVVLSPPVLSCEPYLP